MGMPAEAGNAVARFAFELDILSVGRKKNVKPGGNRWVKGEKDWGY